MALNCGCPAGSLEAASAQSLAAVNASISTSGSLHRCVLMLSSSAEEASCTAWVLLMEEELSAMLSTLLDESPVNLTFYDRSMIGHSVCLCACDHEALYTCLTCPFTLYL